MSKQIRLTLSCLILGLSLPAAAQEQSNGVDALCRSMGPGPVLAISIGLLASILVTLAMIYGRLQRTGWSLANAVSEPTRLSIPLEEQWAQSQGDNQAGIRANNPKGPPTAVTLMEASTSRLIALAGMVAILLIYVGFGIFSLYTFGLTCQMPASTVAVSTFLYSGLTLFAPYVANKVSGLLQPLRQEPAAAPTAATLAPALPPAPSPHPVSPHLPVPPLLPQTHSGFTRASAARLAGVPGAITPPRRLASPAGSPAGPGAATFASAAPLAAAVAEPPYAPALKLIATFEGFVDHAYPDPASGAEP